MTLSLQMVIELMIYGLKDYSNSHTIIKDSLATQALMNKIISILFISDLSEA